MKVLTDQFWNSSLSELKQGYVYEPPSGEFVCLLCGEHYAKGRVYPVDTLLFEAEKAVQIHIKNQHGSIFEYLLGMDKKYTGLTEHQKTILTAFYQGVNDKEIAARMENGNTSTIRNQRFAFREKAKQAKVFLAIMELLEEHTPKSEKLNKVPHDNQVTDKNFSITEPEKAEILGTYFPAGVSGPLSSFPKKEKRKLIILKQLIQRFELDRKYTEQEVNQILKNAFSDYVTLRRYLIEYGLMDREADGSRYWLKNY
ncbi:MAG TPA: transcriptional regulator [Firmicutes bacterium]|nr:transcriptional regulator [Bacillota bacterium]